ncbi:MAG: hypothetical protein QM790_04195 [Nibricoccus sp.]
MKCVTYTPTQKRKRHAWLFGFTLVEVMVGTVLFVTLAVSTGAVFVQNHKMSTKLRYRTQAINVALNFLEQIRVMEFTNIKTLCTAASTNTSAYLRLIVQDSGAPDLTALASPNPTDTSTPGFGVLEVPLGYRNYDFKINVVNGLVKNINPTVCTGSTSSTPGFALDNTSSGTVNIRIPMKFWLTMRYNETISSDSSITAKGEVVEISMVYYWQDPSSSTWQEGTIRAAISNPNAKKSDPT